MKKRQITGLVIGLICTCIVCGGVQIGYAGSAQAPTAEKSISPYTVERVTIAFEKKSSTQAYATVNGYSTNLKTPYVKSKITLQEAPKGSTSFVDTSQFSEKNVNDSAILHTSYFTITSTKDYRIKVELTDVNANDIVATATYYVNMK